MEATTDSTCTSIFQSSSAFDSANYWLMGLPIYRAFDIIHDSAEMKIGFKPQGSNSVVEGAFDAKKSFSMAVLALASYIMF